jgi:hypothetical protein
MTKTYIFKNNDSKKNTFQYNNNDIDYSKILDDIIAADVINKNSYLFETSYKPTYNTEFSIIENALKDSDDDKFTKAVNFLTNCGKKKFFGPKNIIYGKMYTLSDGTPIVFYDDEIQIGFDSYSYSDFKKPLFLSTLKPTIKTTIINLYINIAA